MDTLNKTGNNRPGFSTARKQHKQVIFTVLAILLAAISILSSCVPNNVKQDDSIKKYFDENKLRGCFV